MPARLHPDKKSLIYAEWIPVKEVLEREAERMTEELRKRDPMARKVEVPELIRRLTLEYANKVLSETGEQKLELDPSSSTAAHRGERIEGGKLVPKEKFSPRKKQTLELPADEAKMFEDFLAFKRFKESQEKEVA